LQGCKQPCAVSSAQRTSCPAQECSRCTVGGVLRLQGCKQPCTVSSAQHTSCPAQECSRSTVDGVLRLHPDSASAFTPSCRCSACQCQANVYAVSTARPSLHLLNDIANS
jgi:hypothetical protein